MNKADKKFAIWYGLLVFGFFGFVAGGIFYADTQAGFDIATGYGLPHIQNAYVLNNHGTYNLLYQGHKATLGSNINLGIPDGYCEQLTLNVDPLTRSVTLILDVVDRSFCSP